MSGTSKGGKKFAERKRRENPEYFTELSKKSSKPRGGKNSPGSFKRGNQYAAMGGKAGRRGKGKHRQTNDTGALGAYKLEYEE